MGAGKGKIQRIRTTANSPILYPPRPNIAPKEITKMLSGLESKLILDYKDNPQFASQRQVMLDIDSTIYALVDAMALLPGGEACSAYKCATWDALPNLCGGVEKMLDLIDQAHRFEHMRKIGLMPGAKEAANILRDHGISIHMVTHRNPELIGDAQQFLKEEDFPHDSLICDHDADKVAICTEQRISVLIDDHPEILAAADKSGMSALTIHYPYNNKIIQNRDLNYAAHWGELGPQVLGAVEAQIRKELS